MRSRTLFAFVWLGLMSIPVLAGTATCTVSTSGVAFGSFEPLNRASADMNGTISVTCTGAPGDSANYTITISPGLGSFAARRMVSGSDALIYNVYKDQACTQIWGELSDGSTSVVTDSVTLSGTSVTKNYTAFGRIAAGQNTAKAHGYADSLIVTVSY